MTALMVVLVGADRGAGSELTIVWVDLGLSRRVDQAYARREVSRMLACAGATVEWVVRRPGADFRSDAFKLVFLADDPRRRTHPPMGEAQRNGRPGTAWIMYSSIEAVLQRGDVPFGHELSLAVARVAAHELVHLLTPGRGHQRAGLMKATLDREMLVALRVELDAATCLEVASAVTLSLRSGWAGWCRSGVLGSILTRFRQQVPCAQHERRQRRCPLDALPTLTQRPARFSESETHSATNSRGRSLPSGRFWTPRTLA